MRVENLSEKQKQWILSAVSTDESRPIITKPWVDTGWLVATDGHRLHMLKVDGADGVFSKRFIRETRGFPSDHIRPPSIFDGLIPDAESWKITKLSEMKRVNRSYADCEVINITGQNLNAKYVEDAFAGYDEMLASCEKKNNHICEKIFLLKSTDEAETARVLIMPIYPFDKKKWELEEKKRANTIHSTYRTDAPTCPHCEAEMEHAGSASDDDLSVVECDDCGCRFEKTVHVDVCYSTRSIMPKVTK